MSSPLVGIDTDTIYECYECGHPFRLNPDGTSQHATWDTDLNYAMDEDHVAFGYVDCFQCGAETDVPATDRGVDSEGVPLGVVCDRCGEDMDSAALTAEHLADLAAMSEWG